MSEFEKWFEDQDFYTNMRFIHGDKLFDKDDGAYRLLPVQMTYLAWLVGRAGIKEMDEVIKMQDADLRKYEKQIENLKEQLNNMEQCYIEKKKEVEELQGQLKTWKGQSLAAMLHGTCKCGEPWQSIVSDREGFNLLHCCNCNNDRYENKEFFGDHEPKSLRGAND